MRKAGQKSMERSNPWKIKGSTTSGRKPPRKRARKKAALMKASDANLTHTHSSSSTPSTSSTIPTRKAPRRNLVPLATDRLAERAGLSRHYIRCALRGEFVPHLTKLSALGRAMRRELVGLGPYAHAPIHGLAFELGLVPSRPPQKPPQRKGLSAVDLRKENVVHGLSERSKLSYSLVWKILNRRQPPTPLTAGVLAGALGVSVDELVSALGI